MTNARKNWLALSGAFLISGVFSATYLLLFGADDENLRFVLRLTARCAALIFLLAFIARPLHQVSATAATRTLLKYRRQVGVAFASVHTVHLLLIFLRTSLVPEFEFAPKDYVGGVVYFLILLMLITSFDLPARTIGPKAWKILHKTGLYVITVSFIHIGLGVQ